MFALKHDSLIQECWLRWNTLGFMHWLGVIHVLEETGGQ